MTTPSQNQGGDTPNDRSRPASGNEMPPRGWSRRPDETPEPHAPNAVSQADGHP